MEKMKPFDKEKHKEMKLKNVIQIELAKRLYDCEAHDAMNKWVEEDSASFRDLIEEHPDFIEEFGESLNGEKDKETVLKKIKHELLKKEGKIAEA